jgi:hypothetical protein
MYVPYPVVVCVLSSFYSRAENRSEDVSPMTSVVARAIQEEKFKRNDEGYNSRGRGVCE